MTKLFRSIVCLPLINLLVLQSLPVFAEPELKQSPAGSSGQEFTSAGKPLNLDTAARAGDISAPLSKKEKRALKERVKKLREEKKRQFAELTDGFIRKIITERKVLSKEEFLSARARGLDECIRRAIQESIPARTAEERVKLAKQRILKALRDLFAEATFEAEQRDGGLSGAEFKGKSYHLRFRQPVFRGGNLWATFQKEQATLQAAEAEHRQIVNDLIERVSLAYFESLRTQNTLTDRKRLLKRLRGIIKNSKTMWKQGLISEIEYLNVESLQSQLENDLQEAQQDYELAYLELQKEISLDVNERIELVPFYSYKKIMEGAAAKGKKGPAVKIAHLSGPGETLKPLGEYIKMAYEQRPDLKMEVNRVRSNILAKRAALGKLLPQVNVLLEFGALGEIFTESAVPEPVQLEPDYKPEWQSLVEVVWNLGGSTVKYAHDKDQNAPSVSQFQGGSGTTTRKDSFSVAILDNIEDVYKLRESEIEIMDQFVKLEEQERTVIKEVKEAYFNYKRAEIQFQSAIKQLLYRSRQAQLQKHKMEQNDIQASEYIEAENELMEEKAQFHRVMAGYFVARVGLNRAVGTRDMLPVKEWQ